MSTSDSVEVGRLARHAIPGEATDPAPEGPATGEIRQCPDCGAVVIACDQTDGRPPDPRTPCYVVITGHVRHARHMWLSSLEVGDWPVVATLFRANDSTTPEATPDDPEPAPDGDDRRPRP